MVTIGLFEKDKKIGNTQLKIKLVNTSLFLSTKKKFF